MVSGFDIGAGGCFVWFFGEFFDLIERRGNGHTFFYVAVMWAGVVWLNADGGDRVFYMWC